VVLVLTLRDGSQVKLLSPARLDIEHRTDEIVGHDGAPRMKVSKVSRSLREGCPSLKLAASGSGRERLGEYVVGKGPCPNKF
jgi:hypothetical protein